MAALWNGASGQAWVDEQSLLDQTYREFEHLLACEVMTAGARSVLDIGCGAGATTLAVARALGPQGQALGVDISEPLLELARERERHEGTGARFIRADAQTYSFDARFDLMISRFGVMFFEDSVAAFANLRRAATGDCKLRCMVFRSIGENAFMTTAERAAAPVLRNLPPRKPNAPGQFAFANPEHVRGLLGNAGWSQVELVPVDVPCSFPEAALTRFFTRLGPVGQVLSEADETTRKEATRAIRAAFEPFVHGDEVRFTAACWMIAARASG
jgi:SAM-dependent methyltransferase